MYACRRAVAQREAVVDDKETELELRQVELHVFRAKIRGYGGDARVVFHDFQIGQKPRGNGNSHRVLAALHQKRDFDEQERGNDH